MTRFYRSTASFSTTAATADQPELHPEPNRLAAAVGHGLRHLHQVQLPADEGHGDVDLAPDGGELAIWALIDERRSQNRIDTQRLPEPYARYSADELISLARQAPQGNRDLRWCHTNPQPSQVVVDQGRFVAFVDPCLARIGDRHLDVAIAHLSLQDVFGPEAVMGFYEAYDEDPDLIQLDRAMLLALLAGFGAKPAES